MLAVLVSVSVLFPLCTYLDDIEKNIAWRPPFGELQTHLTGCFLCVMSFYNFSCIPFWF